MRKARIAEGNPYRVEIVKDNQYRKYCYVERMSHSTHN
jgi:hypothetical protein